MAAMFELSRQSSLADAGTFEIRLLTVEAPEKSESVALEKSESNCGGDSRPRLADAEVLGWFKGVERIVGRAKVSRHCSDELFPWKTGASASDVVRSDDEETPHICFARVASRNV